MALKSITIETSDDTDTYLISDILLELGALSVTTTDLHRGTSQEQSIYGEPPQDSITPPVPTSSAVWNHARIMALFPLSTDTESLLMTIATNFNLPQTPTLQMQTDSFEDKTPEEWVFQSQQSFQPIRIGSCAITFPWHEEIAGVCNVVLEPGLAFGTGEHATTRLCVKWIQEAVKAGDRVLDYGTGSGVLGIVAVKMGGAVSAVGVDLDAEAVRMAKGNARRNGVEGRVEFVENREEPGEGDYDVVVANILMGPLKGLADRLVGKMRVGGRIGLSGILVGQAQEVREWYGARGVAMEEAVVEGEWVLLVGTKVG